MLFLNNRDDKYPIKIQNFPRFNSKESSRNQNWKQFVFYWTGSWFVQWKKSKIHALSRVAQFIKTAGLLWKLLLIHNLVIVH